MSVVTLELIRTFWPDVLKPGPLHAKLVGAIEADSVELKLIVPPTQAGPSLLAEIPRVFTKTFVVPVAEQPEPVAPTVTV